MKDPNDKYAEYKVEGDLHFMEPCDIDDKECASRHRDHLLNDFCDDHPSAPQCKVFDE